MKKFLFLILIFLGIISSVASAEYKINKNFCIVNVKKVNEEVIKEYITLDATVKAHIKREIKIELPFVAEEIYISKNQKISKGQKLIKLDKEAYENKVKMLSYNVKDKASLLAKVHNFNEFVLSPVSGTVAEINIKRGDTVNPLLPVIVISDNDNLIIKTEIPWSLANEMKTGEKVLIEGNYFFGELKGTIVSITVSENEIIQGYAELFIVADDINKLQAETEVKIKIEKKDSKKGIIVPESSVISFGDSSFVYVNSNGYAKKKYVNPGNKYENKVEILSGLDIGDILIINPTVDAVYEGAKLNIDYPA